MFRYAGTSDIYLTYRCVSTDFPNLLEREIFDLFMKRMSPVIITPFPIFTNPPNPQFSSIMDQVFNQTLGSSFDRILVTPFLYFPTTQRVFNLLNMERTNSRISISSPTEFYDWTERMEMKKIFSLIGEGSPERYQSIVSFYWYKRKEVTAPSPIFRRKKVKDEESTPKSYYLYSKITVVHCPRICKESDFLYPFFRPLRKQSDPQSPSVSTAPILSQSFHSKFYSPKKSNMGSLPEKEEESEERERYRVVLVQDRTSRANRKNDEEIGSSEFPANFKYSSHTLMYFEEPEVIQLTDENFTAKYSPKIWERKWSEDSIWRHIRDTHLNNDPEEEIKYPFLFHIMEGFHGKIKFQLHDSNVLFRSALFVRSDSKDVEKKKKKKKSKLRTEDSVEKDSEIWRLKKMRGFDGDVYYLPDPLLKNSDIRITSTASPSIVIGNVKEEEDEGEEEETGQGIEKDGEEFNVRYIKVKGRNTVIVNNDTIIGEELHPLRHMDRVLMGRQRFVFLAHPLKRVGTGQVTSGHPSKTAQPKSPEKEEFDQKDVLDVLFLEDLLHRASRMLYPRYKIRYLEATSFYHTDKETKIGHPKKWIRIQKQNTSTKPYQILMKIEDFEEHISKPGEWNKLDKYFGVHLFEKMKQNDLRYASIMRQKFDFLFHKILSSSNPSHTEEDEEERTELEKLRYQNKTISSLLSSLRDLVIHKSRMYSIYEQNWINQLFKPNSHVEKIVEKKLQKLCYKQVEKEMESLRKENEALKQLSSQSIKKLSDLFRLMNKMKVKFMSIRKENKMLRNRSISNKGENEMIEEDEDERDEEEMKLLKDLHSGVSMMNFNWSEFMSLRRTQLMKKRIEINRSNNETSKVNFNIQILGQNEVEKLQSGFHENVIRIQKVLIDKSREVENLKLEKEEIVKEVERLNESIEQKNRELERMRNSEVQEEVIQVLPDQYLETVGDDEIGIREQEWFLLENIANTTNFIKKRTVILSRYENSIKRNWI